MHFERKVDFLYGQPFWFEVGDRFADGDEDGFDVSVGGDEQRPDPARVEQAVWAVERVEALLASAREYLRAFANPARVGDGEWWIVSLELGRRPDDRPDEFEMALHHDTDDARWSVIFRVSPQNVDGFFPIEHRRRYF